MEQNVVFQEITKILPSSIQIQAWCNTLLIPGDKHADLCVQGQSTEQDPAQPCLGSEGFGKQEAIDNVIIEGGHVLIPANSRTPQQLQPCDSGSRVKNGKNDWDN